MKMIGYDAKLDPRVEFQWEFIGDYQFQILLLNSGETDDAPLNDVSEILQFVVQLFF